MTISKKFTISQSRHLGSPILASLLSKGIYSFIAFEVAAAAASYAGFRALRRSENSRKYLFDIVRTADGNSPAYERPTALGGSQQGSRGSLILGSSLILALTCNSIHDYYQKNKPPPDIPVQAWDKVQSVSAPLKGSFPLDHDGSCKLEMLKYMCCLHEKGQKNSECRELAKSYFSCRMDNNLMSRDDWSKLGYDG
ncbi:unnamed protein product [Caenorhabditis auriculariae]|uniref:CHCH domain-containing protein n=1 Tax=Caenorhabditis auriculariae TaxID=2777116 RepID=A0A8S1GSV7_9PELO|nr:unnamed protein product [Caenorhabditis auriculariae]